MKITIITVVYNAERYIADCINSVLAQTYTDIEYILIDGASTDRTFQVAQQYKDDISLLLSAPDKGMYDALNKGIALATGEVIGILNADDMLASEHVIAQVAEQFALAKVEGVYGDLHYVDPLHTSKIHRKWKSTAARPSDVALGWMPAHPTLYLRKKVYNDFGGYSLSYGSAADYELMLRMLYKHKINTVYLTVLMVKMRSGGMSNQSWKHRCLAFLNDYKALKHNKIPFPLLALTLKKLRKLRQFF